MQKYEMLILLNSELTEEAREAELAKYSKIVSDMGGTVESFDKWGVKKTTYPINRRFLCLDDIRRRRTRGCGTRPRRGDFERLPSPHDHETRLRGAV